MACTIASGRIEPCASNLGGLRNVYIINYGAITGYTVAGGYLTATTGSAAAYKFELLNGSSFEETVTPSRDAGTTFYEQVLTLNLNTLNAGTTNTFALLAKGRPQIVVEDNNNNFFLAGIDYGCEATGGTISRGTAMGDRSGYTITFTATEKLPAQIVTGSGGTGSATTILSGVGLTLTP